jgi:hypothetical protein
MWIVPLLLLTHALIEAAAAAGAALMIETSRKMKEVGRIDDSQYDQRGVRFTGAPSVDAVGR